MKATIQKEQSFQPCSILLTFESPEKLQALFHRLNVPMQGLKEWYKNHGYKKFAFDFGDDYSTAVKVQSCVTELMHEAGVKK